MQTVRFTHPERERVIRIGTRRHEESREMSLRPKAGYNSVDPLATDILAAGAEFATAKCLDIPWQAGVGTFKLADVSIYQVRHTLREHGRLILRPHDADDEFYILVTGNLEVFCVHGWILGAVGKQDPFLERYNNRPPAWFVPQKSLENLDTLAIAAIFHGRL